MNPVGYLETSVLYCDDNLHRLSQIPPECIDLIYLDPPFFSNRTYEVIWGDEAEVRSFEDRWEGGINHYVEWMWDRVMEMRRVLKPTGSIYLHCDPHASHYLKVMMDDVFGVGNFRSEVIWKRTNAHSGAKRYGPAHDTLLFYTNSAAYTWNPQHTPYEAKYIEEKFTHVDARGRYRPVVLTGPGTREGESGKSWRDYNPTAIGRHWQPASYLYWKYTQLTGQDLAQWPLLERLDKLDEADLLHRGKRQGVAPNYKFYLEDAPGVPLQDVFADIRPINAQAAERLGYPTQKPVALLERIVAASSNPGDVVLDPFCGCGTTIVAAQRLNRQWIGVDISPTAVNLMKRRLDKEGASNIRLVGMPVSVEQLRKLKPFEFQNWVIQRMNGTHSPRKSGDMGIDGFSFLEHLPIQVKQSERVGRPVVDGFETAVERTGKDRGYIVAFSFTRGAHEETARVRKEKGLQIELVKVGALLEEVPDLVTPAVGGLFGELPLPKAPPKDARPSAEELVESDQG